MAATLAVMLWAFGGLCIFMSFVGSIVLLAVGFRNQDDYIYWFVYLIGSGLFIWWLLQ